jgi:hypothetical protein
MSDGYDQIIDHMMSLARQGMSPDPEDWEDEDEDE